MGNVLSTMYSSDSENEPDEVGLTHTDAEPLSGMDMNTADDLDFAAADLILTANAARLSAAIERGDGEKGTNRTEALASQVATAIQDDDAAIAKRTRIVDAETGDAETVDAETARHDVSAFYLNIARVLVAISLAIQPENDAAAVADETDDVLSPDFSMSHLSFCGSRIQRFAKAVVPVDGTVDTDVETEVGVAEMTTLGNHYGIPELHDLYFDTDYDAETGAFLGMTDETKTVFDRDLARFYQAFSGETTVPDNIKRFGDIPLHENKYTDTDARPTPLFVCKFDEKDEVDCDPLFTSVLGGENEDTELKSRLLAQFAEHLQKMIGTVIARRRALVEMVNKMFVFGSQTVDGERKRRPRVRAYLTVDAVKKIAVDAHQTIIDMSLQCEVDNRIGDELFAALHAIQTLEGNESQIRGMERDLDLLTYA
jgi:hypothetical protein